MSRGNIDALDIHYLARTLARKWRFVDEVEARGSVVQSSPEQVVLSVLMRDEKSQPATLQIQIRFEIGTKVNTDRAFRVGLNATADATLLFDQARACLQHGKTSET